MTKLSKIYFEVRSSSGPHQVMRIRFRSIDRVYWRKH